MRGTLTLSTRLSRPLRRKSQPRIKRNQVHRVPRRRRPRNRWELHCRRPHLRRTRRPMRPRGTRCLRQYRVRRALVHSRPNCRARQQAASATSRRALDPHSPRPRHQRTHDPRPRSSAPDVAPTHRRALLSQWRCRHGASARWVQVPRRNACGMQSLPAYARDRQAGSAKNCCRLSVEARRARRRQ